MKKKAVPEFSGRPFLYGRFHFEDQFRQALIKQGTKLIHIVHLDDFFVRARIAPLSDLRYFKEELNSEDDLRKIKKRARQFKKKSPMVGLKREMTKKAKRIIDEVLDL
jgi:hypothetical protein